MEGGFGYAFKKSKESETGKLQCHVVLEVVSFLLIESVLLDIVSFGDGL